MRLTVLCELHFEFEFDSNSSKVAIKTSIHGLAIFKTDNSIADNSIIGSSIVDSSIIDSSIIDSSIIDSNVIYFNPQLLFWKSKI